MVASNVDSLDDISVEYYAFLVRHVINFIFHFSIWDLPCQLLLFLFLKQVLHMVSSLMLRIEQEWFLFRFYFCGCIVQLLFCNSECAVQFLH